MTTSAMINFAGEYNQHRHNELDAKRRVRSSNYSTSLIAKQDLADAQRGISFCLATLELALVHGFVKFTKNNFLTW